MFYALPISLACANTLPELLELAADPTWIKLGHYEATDQSSTGWRSAIHPGDFFLDSDGITDPVAELKATISALNAAPVNDPDLHAQCRYPARLLWLKSRLRSSLAFRTDIKCPAFDSWTHSNDVASISIIFASGSLGNPATYFGHTLLKFNFRNTESHTSLMDESVNFGAILEGTNDNQMTYIFKSVTGGYDAGFSRVNFYYHDHNYGDHELRDLWEYKLDLPQNETDLIVAHSWEVLGKHYTYYFFKGNCAYQMGKVLEIVDGLHVIPEDRPWTVPQSLVERLSTAQIHNHPLVSEVKYHPSRQSRFYEKYLRLSKKEAQVFESAALNSTSMNEEGFQQLTTPSKQSILDALIDYERYANNPLDKASPEVKETYAAALSMRYMLPPGVPEAESSAPESPDHGRPPGWIQVGLSRHASLGNALSLQIRPAYYDNLDAGSGHVKNGALAMGDLRAEIFRDRLRIEWIDIIHIENVNPAISQLPGDQGKTWGFRIGAEQARLWCTNCLVARIQGDIGYGHQLSSKLFVAGYIGGALQNERNDQGLGFARGSAALIADLTPSTRIHLGYEYRLPIFSDTSNYGVAKASVRWSITSRMDFRIQCKVDEERKINAGLGIYW
jgi:hypothetical protein